MVAETGEPLGVSEIGRRLDLPASTVYRALITLEESDYIVRFQNMPRYELGPMPRLLNRALVHRFRLHAASRPYLRDLAETTGETASISVRLGWYGLRLAGVYGHSDIYHRDRLGEAVPLHLTLPGRGILAFLDDAAMTAYCAFVTAHHPADVDWPALSALLERARDIGFEHEELAPGLGQSALAMPVREPGGQVIAAIAISGPIYTPGSGQNCDAWLAVRDALEADIAGDPAAFRSPFAHLAADDIVIAFERDAAPR